MARGHVTLGTLVGAALLLVFALNFEFATADEIINKREVDESELSNEPRRSKRPFCNAFTGCGRKRSDDSLGGALPELQSSEPAVAELSRQILSEAKMWEAIQEARAELQHRRQLMARNPAAMLERGGAAEPMQLSYRKRRDVHPAPPPQQAATTAKNHHKQAAVPLR